MITIDSAIYPLSKVSNSVQSDRKRVKFDKNSNSQSETQVSYKPTADTSQLDLTNSELANIGLKMQSN